MSKQDEMTIGWTEKDVEMCLEESRGIDKGSACCDGQHYSIETPEQFQELLKALGESDSKS